MKWPILCVTVMVSCVDEVQDQSFLITDDRVLAIRGIPAEVRPGQDAQYEVLLASNNEDNIDVDFSYCTEARRAEERQGISESCLLGDSLQAIQAETTMLSDACSRFGPNTPPSQNPLEPPLRPSDPDPSGGYFVPIRAETLSTASFGQHRIRCDLAGATRALFEEFNERYISNNHPVIQTVRAPDVVEPFTSYELSLEVNEASFEPYVIFDAEESLLRDAKETVRVSWYVNKGELSISQGRVFEDTKKATTVWTAADDGFEVKGWVVVRDDRGGIDFKSFKIAE